jgi:hypothetical protein
LLRSLDTGEYKISNNIGAMLCCNPARGKGNKLVGADAALAPLNVGRVADAALNPLNVGRAADATKMADPMAPPNVWRPMDAMKVADLIMSDNDGSLLDLKTTPATKPTAKPIIMLPPYEAQDPDIDGCNGLDRLNRLDKLQGASA